MRSAWPGMKHVQIEPQGGSGLRVQDSGLRV